LRGVVAKRSELSIAPRYKRPLFLRRCMIVIRQCGLQATLARRPEIALVALTHRLILRTFGAGYVRDSALQIEVDTAALQGHAKDLAGSKAQSEMEALAEQLRTGLPEDADALFA
jgi:ParB family chromosome partitioning protein